MSMRVTQWIEKNTYDKKRPDHFGLRYHVDTFDGRKKTASRVFTSEGDANKYAKQQIAKAAEAASKDK